VHGYVGFRQDGQRRGLQPHPRLLTATQLPGSLARFEPVAESAWLVLQQALFANLFPQRVVFTVRSGSPSLAR
jgi:hypothetical protein